MITSLEYNIRASEIKKHDEQKEKTRESKNRNKMEKNAVAVAYR